MLGAGERGCEKYVGVRDGATVLFKQEVEYGVINGGVSNCTVVERLTHPSRVSFGGGEVSIGSSSSLVSDVKSMTSGAGFFRSDQTNKSKTSVNDFPFIKTISLQLTYC